MEFLKNNRLNIFIVLLWLVIAVFTMFHHELWRDEAQVWCVVRDASIIDIFKISAIEGHPPLWYILILPFAKLGLPVISMQLVSLLLVFASVIYFVFKTPFNNLNKILTVFSSGMIYYLPIVSRNYALIPILLFITANLYEKRLEHPYKYAIALILLSNTHVLILGLCTILFILFAYEKLMETIKNKNIKLIYPIFLVALNFIFLAGYLSIGIFNNVVVRNYSHQEESLYTILKNYALLFYEFRLTSDLLHTILFYSLIGIIAIVLFKYSKKLLSIYIFTCIYIFFIYKNIWFNGIQFQKSYILILAVIFCCWVFLKTYKNKVLNIVLSVLLLISCINSVNVILCEINYNFSASKQVAKYIKTNLDSEETFCVIGPLFTFTPIAAYLPDKYFYSPMNEIYTSYFIFSYFNIKKEKNISCRYYIVQKSIQLQSNLEPVWESDKYVVSTNSPQAEVFTIYKKRD